VVPRANRRFGDLAGGGVEDRVVVPGGLGLVTVVHEVERAGVFEVRDRTLVLEREQAWRTYAGLDRWADADEQAGLAIGHEDIDADGQVAGSGVIECGPEVGADAIGRDRVAEDLAGTAVEAVEVQVETVDPAGPDLHRTEVAIAGCPEQRRVDGAQRFAVQQEQVGHTASLT
jgi:hypothetical protein